MSLTFAVASPTPLRDAYHSGARRQQLHRGHPKMVAENPLMNAYYKDKIVDWNKIRIPTYVTAGWVHHHLRGAFEGFRRIRSPKKWMRAHRDFEWPDTYKPENMEDVRKFFDRYCKEIHNGWEMTPRVRIDVMDAMTTTTPASVPRIPSRSSAPSTRSSISMLSTPLRASTSTPTSPRSLRPQDRNHDVHLRVHRGYRDHWFHEAAPQRRVPRL